ncbi:hypothetical protein ACFV9G_13550 [Nocardioides sp. NPDC059952]|uniref:hypothetical protein n=1 Tax=Nocardioides sp. NPDC059952 TaxID=3347014 RepID=UPI00364BDBE1
MEEPFFNEVRRRRPDIDLVILPPVEPPARRASAEDVAASVEVVDAAVAAIVPRIPGAVVAEPRWEPVSHNDVRRRAEVSADLPDGAATLERLRQAFAEARWESRLEVKAFHRWTARSGDADIVGFWSSRHGHLSITVSGRAIAARDLVQVGS